MRPRTARHPFRAALVLGVLLLGIFASPSEASTDNGKGDGGGEGSGPFTGLSQAPAANLFTGAMTMSVPILIPPGRKNATPKLDLTYSSSGGHGPFGMGWDLPLGDITRSTKHGVPRCTGPYTQDFVLQIPGGAVELVFISGEAGYNLYRARTDEAYLEAHAYTGADDNNYWEVFDRRGTKFVFGKNANARVFAVQDQFLDTGSCAFTTRWALTEIADPNHNTIRISYEKDENALYPDMIEYGANAGPGSSVPDHPFRVTFSKELRQDLPGPTSYHSGVKVILNHLVTGIEVEYMAGSSFASVRSYVLGYVQEVGKALLETVEGTDLPTQTFEYSPVDFGSTGETQAHASPPPGNLREWNVDYPSRGLLDMNGDGIVDLVDAASGGPGVWRVYLGGPNGMASTEVPCDSSTLPASNALRNEGGDQNHSATSRDTFDITGDGIPDWVDSNAPWTVFPGYWNAQGCGFGPATSWPAPVLALPFLEYQEINGSYSWTRKRVMDMNADGLPDLVYAPGGGAWSVYLNHGAGFETTPADFSASGPIEELGLAGSQTGNLTYRSTTSTHFDFNGDGLPDRVERSRYGSVQTWAGIDSDGKIVSLFPDDDFPDHRQPAACADGFSNPAICSYVTTVGGAAPVINVYLNTGRGFETVPIRNAIPYVTRDPYGQNKAASGFRVG